MKLAQRLLIVVVATGALSVARAQTDDSLQFPLPEILRDNVEFWTKIYTEVSLNEGLLHDRDYPSIIYKKITTSQPSSSGRTQYIDQQRDSLVASVTRVVSQPESTWTDDDRGIAELLRARVPPEDMAGAPERVRFQRGQKERFLEGLRRSGAYIDTIKAIFAQYGIPSRVAYLPHVESSFDVEAYSKVGAAGLWQFMRGTGKLFLTVNYLVDERRDPYLSTVAAARLLRGNFDELGTWPLAITAYNHGTNGMKSAVATTGSRDLAVIIQRHTSRSFKFASKNFYGCFLAASRIAADPTPYFGDVAYQSRHAVNEIVLDRYMTPEVISTFVGVGQDTLAALNPALRPIVFGQQRAVPAGYRLRIPAGLAPENALAALTKVPDSLKSVDAPRPKYYQVERGDNLYAIAGRLGVTAQALAQENEIDRKHRIYAGQVLRVPQPIAVASSAPAPAPKPETVRPETTQAPVEVVEPIWAVAHAVAPVETVAAPPSPRPEPKHDVKDVYAVPAVVAKDTASHGAPSATPRFDVSIYDLDVKVSSAGDHAEIRVTTDETIGHFAGWLGISAILIRELNGMGASSDIRINQTLRLPFDKASVDRFVAARLEYHMALEEDFYATYKVTGVVSRPIRRGETLWDICNGEEQIPLWLLKKHNATTDLTKLSPGTLVAIPTLAEKTAADKQAQSAVPAPPPAPYREPIRPGVRAVERVP